MIGNELAYTPDIGLFEKIYIKIFGVPINGLRIRLRHILPVITGNYKKILDAGCGRAVFSFQLAKKFPEATVIGVDTDEEQLAVNRCIAQQAGLANVIFKPMDVASLDYHEEFDLILSVDNLEHIEDDRKALQDMVGALKKHGRLVLHVPGRERRWFFFTFQKNFDVPGHCRPGYSLNEINEKVKSVGMEVLSSRYTYGFLENLTNNISYLITGAEAKNRVLYALAFPFLNLISWFGKNSIPQKGAGILLVAEKK